MGLDDLRTQIDEIDEKLVALLEKRFETSERIAREKIKEGTPVLDVRRERVVLDRAAAGVRGEQYRPYVTDALQAVMAQSRALQRVLLRNEEKKAEKPAIAGNAAYCGIPGSNAEEAASAYFGEGCALVPQSSFAEVVQSVLSGQCENGMLPVENSSAGAVTAVEDLLLQHDVFITGEWILPISHHLLGVPGAEEQDIKTVCSHPQAIEQCMRFISERGYDIRLSGNTAFAARDVARDKDRTVAAIASERAAELYGLSILRRNIQLSADNSTRFIAIGRELKDDGDKLSIVCAIPHKPGSLYALLSVFANRNLNLLKLLARPMPESPWHYRFHIDISGNIREKNVQKAFAEARILCRSFKVTGCYRAAL